MAQVLYTVEIRADFSDETKHAVFKKAIQQSARFMFAQASLLNDGIKPECAIYAHDYFLGHADIAMLDDDIQSGLTAITEAGNSALTAGEAVDTLGRTHAIVGGPGNVSSGSRPVSAPSAVASPTTPRTLTFPAPTGSDENQDQSFSPELLAALK